MAKYTIIHTLVGAHSRGAVVDEADLIPLGIDGKPVEKGPVFERLLGLGAVKVYNSNDDDTSFGAVDVPASSQGDPLDPKKLTDSELLSKALDIGIDADQAAKLKRKDLEVAVAQAQDVNGAIPSAV